ncbi:glycoside hydrolase family 43 protein [Sphingobium sp. AR-3-1]|uniref:Glycoside hydrolase family 43 protein n=1 Tax=Sphingobium psychrophilum TaxID=2728834 RepID=A0A7X9ZTQ4_9SPHN|nr:glycoside hydrolase family 43 protein [Sphingobium psychrophilum]NML12263.1 glycoside hydrolase family 43 protein [Sphingobium psychrophilum]
MTVISNPILPGFNPDPSILRVGDDFYIATSTFEWYPGVQIHHSRDLKHWRLVARPLARASQLDMRGAPDSCGVWAPDLSYADGRFWLIFTDVKRYGVTTVNGARGASLRDFPNYVVHCDHVDGDWSDATHLNSSGFDPALFHDEDGRSWMLNMLWDHRPGRGRFAGIQIQLFDRAALKLVGEPHLIFKGTDLGFTEGPHIYKRDEWYHLLVAEGGTGWDHAVVMARSCDLLGPYEVHPDGVVLTASGNRHGPLTRTGHGDLVELQDGTPWLTYLCGRPVPEKARCILGRETAIQPMRWHDDGWLRTLDGDAKPMEAPRAPDLPPMPWPQNRWNGRFDRDSLPPEFQWLRTPMPERLFSLFDRPGFLRLYGRETVGSHFEQALVARRLEHRRFTATTCLDFAPRCFQQAAGLILYYNSTKYYYLSISVEEGARELQLMIASPELAESVTIEGVGPLPEGPIELRAQGDGDALIFSWRSEESSVWQILPHRLDGTILSDEVTFPGLPNFTGTFVGMACQDASGMATPADFAWFLYEGGDDRCAPVD